MIILIVVAKLDLLACFVQMLIKLIQLGSHKYSLFGIFPRGIYSAEKRNIGKGQIRDF